MLPTLKPGQDILSFNWLYKPKVRDLVVVRHGGKEIIKRVTKVLDQGILIEGDNKDESTDSRDFGYISMDQIVGRVVYPSATSTVLSTSSLRASQVPCPQCELWVIGIYGRKDAICKNCGFKLTCCE